MAQLVEQLIRNQQVIGSSPITSSKGFALSCEAFFVNVFGLKHKQKTLLKKADEWSAFLSYARMTFL